MADKKDQDARAGRNVTIVGMLANAVLIVIKLIAGIVGHSQGLIADAIHSMSDLVTDAVVLLGLRIGRKAPDKDHPFGHARLETLASTIVGGILVVVAVIIGYDAAKNIYFHTESHPTWVAVFAALVSIIIKEAIYRYTIRVGRAIKSSVVVANAWHHRSDALSSCAVLIGLIGAQIKTSWHILDAFAALIVSMLILKVGLDILWIALKEFTDTAPDQSVLDQMTDCAKSVSGVFNVHDLKARTSGGLMQVEIHVAVKSSLSVLEGHRIAKEVESCLERDVENIDQIIVHVDPV